MIDPRDYIDSGMNRARLRLEARRGAVSALVVLLGLGVAAVLGAGIVSRVSKSALADTYELRFQLDDATGVVPGVNEVRFKGVSAGTITDVGTEDDHAVITVKIQSEFRRMYRDVRAQLRPSTALQDMFLDVTSRGTTAAGVLADGALVPSSQTETPVNISDVLNVLRPNVRVRLRTLLDDLGNGMHDQGRSLRAILTEALPFIRSAGMLSRELSARAPLVRRLVHNLGTLTEELGGREQQLRTLVTEGATTLSTLQAGSADLDATLRELPSTLDHLRSSFAAVQGVLPDVDDAARALMPAAEELPGGLSELSRLGTSAQPAIAALQRPVRRLVPLAQALRPLSHDLDAATRRLGPQADTVDKVTRDLVACKKGIQGFFQWNASMAKFGDVRGAVPRGNVVMGAQSSGVLNDPFEFAPQACAPGRVMGGRVAMEKDKQ
ncbi:MAG: hypothetical protein JWO02_3291 [Solirubrobacterales bacterium]|nr:hypothetical protein [Solirubrobacterales bacterium]